MDSHFCDKPWRVVTEGKLTTGFGTCNSPRAPCVSALSDIADDWCRQAIDNEKAQGEYCRCNERPHLFGSFDNCQTTRCQTTFCQTTLPQYADSSADRFYRDLIHMEKCGIEMTVHI